MSSITSTTVSRRFQRVSEAAGQAVNLAPAVAAALADELRPTLQEGESLPDLDLLQQLISRRLALAGRELDEGDHNRKHIKNIDRHRKVVLGEASQRLRSALVDVRYILDRTLTKAEAFAAFEGRSNLARLKSPVIERVSARLVSLLEDPKLGWDTLEDEGYRQTAEAARRRLKNALSAFNAAQQERLPEKDALVLAQGSFDRSLEEKQRRMRRLLRCLRGIYEGAGFQREADALILRRRAKPQPVAASRGLPAPPP